MPPSQRELKIRLQKRNTDDPAGIKIRVEKAGEEMKLADQFDHIVINDSLELAEKEVYEIVKSFIENQNE
jgi:guanylate kinase